MSRKDRATATLTIRGLDIAVKEQLQRQAKQNGRSMESQARSILQAAAFPGKQQVAYVKHGGLSALSLPDQTQRRLSELAQKHSRSVEDEARAILERGTRPVDAGRLIYELSREHGGFEDFELPERTGSRNLPGLS